MSRPPHETARREALLAHLMEFLGDQYVVAPETADHEHPVDLAVFAPSEQVPHPTLVTLGLSERPMRSAIGSGSGASGDSDTSNAPNASGDSDTSSGGEYRLELLLGLPAGWPGIDPPQQDLLETRANSWPLQLLKDTARIPGADGSVLDWGHSITRDGVPYDESVPFTGALIGPPYGYPPQLMNASTPQGPVQLLAVLPATPEELALQASVPSGGDMLLGRWEQAGVTAVVDPGRDTAADGPAPWRLHVLLREPAEHLGQVLDGVLPNVAEQLGAQGIDEFVLPIGPEPLRWRVGGRFAPSALEQDLALQAHGASSGQGALREEGALREAVAHHATVLTISPERPGDGATVTGAAAMAAMLAEAGKAAAIWLPHQRHVALPEQFLTDIEAELPTTCRVHPATLADGRPAVRTHGLEALGGLEVQFSAPGLSQAELRDRLNRMLVECTEKVGAAPAAGQRAQLGEVAYELRTVAHPDSGLEVLEMAVAPGTD